MNYKDLSGLISLFKKHQYEIIIKFHPSYKGNFKKEFINDRSIKIFNAYEGFISQRKAFNFDIACKMRKLNRIGNKIRKDAV